MDIIVLDAVNISLNDVRFGYKSVYKLNCMILKGFHSNQRNRNFIKNEVFLQLGLVLMIHNTVKYNFESAETR